MKSISLLGRLLTGLLLICLASMAFIGCNDVTSLNGLIPSQLTGAIARPAPAPAGTNDNITWADPAADPNPGSTQAVGVSDGLSLSSPSMNFTATSSVAGQVPAIILEIINDANGNVVGTSAPIPLVQQGTGLATGQIAIPQTAAGQSYIVRLAPWTLINVASQAFSRQLPAGLQIGDLMVAFDIAVLNVSTINASFADQFQLNLNRTTDNKFMLQQSTLNLKWKPGNPIPTDGKAGLVVRLFDGGVNVGVHRQTRVLGNGAVEFSGLSTTPFTKCDVLLDLRNTKPSPTDLNFPN